MKYYYDTQARCVVSETKLLNEFYCSNADDYGNFYDFLVCNKGYINDCVRSGGSIGKRNGAL